MNGLTNNKYDQQFQNAGTVYKVPWKLLKAICMTESNLDFKVINVGDGKGNNHAIGLCQVLISTAEQLGYNQPNHKCHIVLDKKDINNKNCMLYDVDINIKYAAIYLKYQLIRYGNNWSAAAAAYNSGTVNFDKNGVYRNQKYVNKVINNLLTL